MNTCNKETAMNRHIVEKLIRNLLVEIGENPDREGLRDTPRRVTETWNFLSSGYRSDLNEIVRNAVFKSNSNGMILCKDIEVYSLCEHHMLPFFGTCTIGYIPRGEVIGISKLARVVDYFSRRLQFQERLTADIAKTVLKLVNADGSGVVINARHMCMAMRGVEKQHSSMTTSSVLGSFHADLTIRTEFFTLAKN